MKARSKCIAMYLMTIAIAATSVASPEKRYEEAVLRYLRPALLEAKKTGRLYYVTPCRDFEQYFPVPFPEVKAQAPLSARPGLDAVREIFGADDRVTASEKPDGIIKVRIGEIPTTILQTKISFLRLKPGEQYDPTRAVWAFTGAKAVRAAMRKLDIEEPAVVFSLPLNLPSKTAPHLPAVIRDVTLDEALDLVAKTFGAIVIFGECTSGTGPRFMQVYTVYLQRAGGK